MQESCGIIDSDGDSLGDAIEEEHETCNSLGCEICDQPVYSKDNSTSDAPDGTVENASIISFHKPQTYLVPGPFLHENLVSSPLPRESLA